MKFIAVIIYFLKVSARTQKELISITITGRKSGEKNTRPVSASDYSDSPSLKSHFWRLGDGKWEWEIGIEIESTPSPRR